MLSSNLLSLLVSYQENAWAKLSKDITLGDSLRSIKDGTYKRQVGILRSYIESDQIDLYKANKTKLPAVTFSASFNLIRNRDSIANYNRVLVLDIDNLSNEKLIYVKQILLNDDYIYAFWESPSMAGIKGLIFLEYDDEFEGKDLNASHKYAFKCISKYFQEKYEIELDVSGSDITRLCFFSHDENLFQREEIRRFNIKYKKEALDMSISEKKDKANFSLQATSNRKFNPLNRNKSSDRYTIKSVITFLKKRGKTITQDYNSWYQVAFAISNTFTYDVGLKHFLELSQLDSEKYNEKNCIAMLEYSYQYSDGSFNFGTIIYLAKINGYREKKGVPKVGVRV